MKQELLGHFPRQTHALTVVSDPDDLLVEEGLLGELADRGFTVVMEDDPVLLRHRVERARPWTPDHPLVVIAHDRLGSVPYDLWQPAHRVTLSLNGFFPTLAYPVVSSLSPSQRLRLAAAAAPPDRLGPTSSIAFVLRHAFDADPAMLADPTALVSWLNRHHAAREPFPRQLRDQLLSQLQSQPGLAALDLPTLLDDPAAFARFMREQWHGYVRRTTGQAVREAGVPYILRFERDAGLQDDVIGLLRTGVLEPVAVGEPDTLPVWARLGVRAETDDRRQERADILLTWLEERLPETPDEWRWAEWQAVARSWAELTLLRFDANPVNLEAARLSTIEATLDSGFRRWLRRRYAALAGQVLPQPHHVHHVPHLLARERQRTPGRRVALIIMDGLSLVDWALVGPIWRQRHPAWRIEEQLLLAQIPTITAISRQALVSGRRPEQFAGSIATNVQEARHWERFWTGEGLAPRQVSMERISLDDAAAPAPSSSRARALCWIINDIDEIVHGATLGTPDVLASLGLWLNERSSRLEDGIAALLAAGFTVVIGSDHGHVAARGAGPLAEGMAVETKGKRARTYRDRHLADRAAAVYPDTTPWGDDGLLPGDLWALMPTGRTAFAPIGDTMVTHGGITIEEVVVPLVTIRMDESA